ncbi:hypothetical protein PF008_g1072 [Phytophthora fragariae]|uniref:Uncharacterized protein n=1 Tax=Phytophthora fragariae TaxID=53985 RepID=A0A6G0SLD4_9STRA|nr:hypothetical protein PF008_g1072 [Phytophthora fragariae]
MQEELPAVLEEERTLAEMRAAKKRAISAVKKYKVSRRVYRLQRKQQQEEQRRSVDISHQRPEDRKRSRKKNDGYTFARQGNYGDVELVTRGEQVRASRAVYLQYCWYSPGNIRKKYGSIAVISTARQGASCASTEGVSRETHP